MSDRARRPGVRGLVAAAGIAAALATGPSQPGSAGAAIQSGWWMAPVAVAPDAPPDGIVVQGGAPEVLAYGAVGFSLTGDEVPESLLLRVAPDSASTPGATLALCLLTEPFTPVQGGPMTDAPAYDCDRAVDAEPSDDGTTYTFEVATLVEDAALAVAILPTAATDRVVLSAPGPYSLTMAGTAVTPPASDPSSPVLDAPGATSDLPVSAVPVGGTPTFPSDATPTPDVTTPPAGSPPLVAAPTTPDDGSGGHGWLPPLLFVCLAAVAVGLWSAAGAAEELGAELPTAPA